VLSVVTEKQFQEFGLYNLRHIKLYGTQSVTVFVFAGGSVLLNSTIIVEFNKQN